MGRKNQIQSSNFNQKPLWFTTLNSMWKSSYAIGTEVKLDKDRLIKSARRETGLQDFGSYFWDEITIFMDEN